MKKFEEEMKEWFGSPTGFNMEFQSGYEAYSALIKRFKGYISPDDHQAEIGKIELQNLKYREEIARMQKSLRKKNKAIKELNAAVKKSKARLKECEDLRIEANNSAAMEYSRKCEVVEERAELKRENQRLRAENLAVKTLVEDAKKQQPEIPEVSKEVANIYEKHKDQHHKLSVILEELYVNTFATFGSSLTQGEVDDIVVAMRTNGYTVAKEKRYEVVFLEDETTRQILMENQAGYHFIEEEDENYGYWKQDFTEKEIKAINEKFWLLSVPVEDNNEI